MATQANLAARPRSETGKGANRQMRMSGRIPAVVYGHGEETRKLSVDAHELERLFSRIHVENTLITLEVDGAGGPVKALVREIQTNSVRNQVLHVDFYLIHAGEKLTVQIPIKLVGAAPGVKAGGVMQHALDELEVSCLPDAIPERIEVDISGLEIGDSIHVRELVVPEGVEVETDEDRTVCSVVPPAVLVEEVPAEPVVAEVVEPEVIGRGKPEEEEEGD
ncbi:MAG: 50S ribosomal protein L25/general stress protein Ctc [Longimicrobiales bacterium]